MPSFIVRIPIFLRRKTNATNFETGYEDPPPKEKESRKLQLYKAAKSGDWEKAEQIFNNSENITPRTTISKLGETALHIATAADRTEFVEYLVDLMSEADLAIKTERGNTAFCYAAVSGNIQAATFMLRKHNNLSTIRGEGDILPIRTAALHGHHKMVHHLYEYMNHQNLDNSDWLDVFMAFIDCDIYDIGWQMLSEKLWLATKANSKGLTALYTFASKSHITSHNFSRNICGGLLTKYFSRRRNNVLRKQGLELLILLLEETMLWEEESSELIKNALFRAAKQGNYEFLTTVIHLYPNLAFELDENYHTIFHIAVSHRHVDIFNIVHQMDSIKNVIKLMKDNNGNNILHLAGKSPSSGALEVVQGAALQLQRELLWFEAVEQLVGGQRVEANNKDQQNTPRQLFEEEHKELKKEGEKWLTRTANSCMVVSTLIATVAFTGIFSVPGGNGQDTGIPVLLDNIWFEIFAVFDAITLISSASSILLFLSILTSRYSMADFLKSLPLKLLFGLFSLFISLMTMMVAFIAAFFVIFKHKKHYFAYPVAAAASIPILLVAFLHLPHFC